MKSIDYAYALEMLVDRLKDDLSDEAFEIVQKHYESVLEDAIFEGEKCSECGEIYEKEVTQ